MGNRGAPRYVSATAVLGNPGGTVKLLRDDSVLSLMPRPDFAAIFPLAVCRDPAPPFPFTDEVDRLDDDTRPLVLDGYNRPGVLKLVKDTTPGVNSVVLAP